MANQRVSRGISLQMTLFMLSAVLLTTWTARASAEVGLDWKISHLYPKSLTNFEGPMAVRCEWDATIAKSGRWTKPIHWFGLISLDGTPVDNFERAYTANDVVYSTMTATNEFHGFEEATFPVSAGTHKIGCTIAVVGSDTHESASRSVNNRKEITINVKAMQSVAPATFPTARPKLTLTVKGTSPNSSCQDPANLAWVSVSVHSNLALASSKGTVRAVDVSPTSSVALQSNPVVLPAIGANSSVPITIVLGANVPPTPLVNEIHTLDITLNPYVEAGQPAFDSPSSALAIVGFPMGWCP